MRDLVITLLAIVGVVLSIGHMTQEVKITNLERQLSRIENDYQVVAAENAQLQRINEQNLRLLSSGGWNEGE